VLFFSFLVLFLVRLNSGAQRRTFHAVSKGRHHLAFLCRAPPRGAWQRFLAVRFCGMRTAKEFHRAKICRVPFVVRLDPSEFEKARGVKSGTVGVLKPGTASSVGWSTTAPSKYYTEPKYLLTKELKLTHMYSCAFERISRVKHI
jgi:hypothetical protein